MASRQMLSDANGIDAVKALPMDGSDASASERTHSSASGRRSRLRRQLVGGAAAALVLLAVPCDIANADVPDQIQRVARWMGFGWGDGYHTCKDGGCRPGADLPPNPYTVESGQKKMGHRLAFLSGGEACGAIYPASAGTVQSSASCASGNCMDSTIYPSSAPVDYHNGHVSNGVNTVPVAPQHQPLPTVMPAAPTVMATPQLAPPPQEPQAREPRYREPQQREPLYGEPAPPQSSTRQPQRSNLYENDVLDADPAPRDWSLEPDPREAASPSDLQPGDQDPLMQQTPGYGSEDLLDEGNLLDDDGLLDDPSFEELPAPRGMLDSSSTDDDLLLDASRGRYYPQQVQRAQPQRYQPQSARYQQAAPPTPPRYGDFSNQTASQLIGPPQLSARQPGLPVSQPVRPNVAGMYQNPYAMAPQNTRWQVPGEAPVQPRQPTIATRPARPYDAHYIRQPQ